MSNFSLVSLIYDIAAVAIVFGLIKHGSKVGFTRSVVRVLGFALLVGAAIVVSRIGAVVIYRVFMEPKLVEMIEGSLSSTGSGGSMVAELQEALSSLPAISFLLFDISSSAGQNLDKIVDSGIQSVAGTVVDEVISPVVEPMLRGVIFVLVLLIGGLVVRGLVSGSSFVKELPVVGALDGFLGGVFGAVEGLVVLAVFAVLVYLAIVLWGGRWDWLSRETVAGSFMFKFIYILVTGDKLQL